MNGSSKLIPFGKYKDQPVEVLAGDVSYLEYMINSGAFSAAKTPSIYNFYINNGRPAETPRHNELQARLLSEALRKRIALGFLGRSWISAIPLLKRGWICSYGCKEFPSHLSACGRNGARGFRRIAYYHWNPQYQCALRDAESLFCIYPRVKVGMPNFEHKGWDVYYTADVDHTYGNEIAIEIKPIIGDDFPAVLRQMKAQRDRLHCDVMLCLYEKFAATSVSESAVQEMFRSSGFSFYSISLFED